MTNTLIQNLTLVGVSATRIIQKLVIHMYIILSENQASLFTIIVSCDSRCKAGVADIMSNSWIGVRALYLVVED
jgi:hypothetical protein